MLRIIITFLSLLCFLAGFGCSRSELAEVSEKTTADKVFINGNIYTVDQSQPWATAIGIKDGKIIAVGSDADVASFAGTDTEKIDLNGKFMMPGIHDSHIHTVTTASKQYQIYFRYESKTWEDITHEIKTYAAEHPDIAWVYGGTLPWIGEEAIEDADGVAKKAHKTILDEIVSERPVALTDFSLHSMLANSKALEMAGITKDTPDPEGGTIERDANGEPTGVLREMALNLISEAADQVSEDDYVAALPPIFQQLNSLGITSISEAYLHEEAAKALKRLDETGKITVRMKASMAHASSYVSHEEKAATSNMIENRRLYEGKRIKLDRVKFFLDGAGYDSAMVDPYPNPPEGKNPLGKLAMSKELYETDLIKYHGMGIGSVTHVSGDRAARIALDTIEKAYATHGETGVRHVLAHCTIVNAEDWGRFETIGAIAEFSPYFWWPITPGIEERFIKRIGEERAGWVWAVKEMVMRGAHAAAGSDMPVISDPNPFRAMEGLLTRKNPDGILPDESFNADQAVSLEEAVKMFTIGGAYHLNQEKEVGSLEAGKYADFIILDRNIFEIPITDVSLTRVLQTWLAGELIYDKTQAQT